LDVLAEEAFEPFLGVTPGFGELGGGVGAPSAVVAGDDAVGWGLGALASGPAGVAIVELAVGGVL
jgi:hypothetical protein